MSGHPRHGWRQLDARGRVVIVVVVMVMLVLAVVVGVRSVPGHRGRRARARHDRGQCQLNIRGRRGHNS